MHLEHLRLANFRCIERFDRELPPGRILVTGDNARGKTSLLEAMFYLVTGRSFRTRNDQDCIPSGAPAGTMTAVRGRVRRDGGDSCRLAVTLGEGVKSVRVDEQPLRQLADLWGQLHAVLFTPDDLQLIKGGPGERRRYLDMALSQISRDFLFHLQRYSQALRQRNALLKRAREIDDALRAHVAPWDAQLVEHGVPIMRARAEFLRELEPLAARLHGEIVGEKPQGDQRPEVLELEYANFLREELPDDAETAGRFGEQLARNLSDDLRRGMTETGPHRDNFIVCLGGRSAREFGSQGQVRSCVLALRLAEVIEMQRRTGEAPLLLLDDLASELDPERKHNVLQLLDDRWQVFMTTTRREDFGEEISFADTIDLPGAATPVGLNGENHGD